MAACTLKEQQSPLTSNLPALLLLDQNWLIQRTFNNIQRPLRLISYYAKLSQIAIFTYVSL